MWIFGIEVFVGKLLVPDESTDRHEKLIVHCNDELPVPCLIEGFFDSHRF